MLASLLGLQPPHPQVFYLHSTFCSLECMQTSSEPPGCWKEEPGACERGTYAESSRAGGSGSVHASMHAGRSHAGRPALGQDTEMVMPGVTLNTAWLTAGSQHTDNSKACGALSNLELKQRQDSELKITKKAGLRIGRLNGQRQQKPRPHQALQPHSTFPALPGLNSREHGMQRSTGFWKHPCALGGCHSHSGSHAAGFLLRAHHLRTVPPAGFQADNAATPPNRHRPWEATPGL